MNSLIQILTDNNLTRVYYDALFREDNRVHPPPLSIPLRLIESKIEFDLETY